MRMKKSSTFIWIMAILALIAVYMLGRYFWQFAENGWSNDPMEWGAFGSYMGAITGLLAFVGVLYSVHNANKKSAEAKEEAEKVRKEAVAENKKIREEAREESERLGAKAEAKEERELFFKLIESHQKMMNSLISIDLKTHEKTEGMQAFEVYKKEMYSDLQLMIIHWKAGQFTSYAGWQKNIKMLVRDEFELTLFVAMFAYDANQINRKDEPLQNDEELVKIVLSNPRSWFRDLRKGLDDPVKYGRLKPFYVNFSTEEREDLLLYAGDAWCYTEIDVRYSLLRLAARCFYTRNLARLSFHFNNLCYITKVINDFKFNRDYYMDYWIANLNTMECELLFFYLLSGKSNMDISEIAINSNLFKNVPKDQIFTVMPEDKTALEVLNEFLQMQIDYKEEINFNPVAEE